MWVKVGNKGAASKKPVEKEVPIINTKGVSKFIAMMEEERKEEEEDNSEEQCLSGVCNI